MQDNSIPFGSSVQRVCPVCKKEFRACAWKVRMGWGIYCSVPCRAIGKHVPFADRFWAFVSKTDSCWLWTGAGSRYGVFDKGALAHRVAWILTRGEIPAGLEVCHNCPGGDNPRCVNPSHLFLGTRADNARDAVKKGTMARGERTGAAKLTVEQVLEIRAKYTGRNGASLAREFGISKSNVSQIVRRISWIHI